MKKVILVSLLVSSMFLNTACDDSEIAAGIIGVGIGIGIAAGSDHDHDHHHRRHDYDNGYRDGHRDGYHDGRRDDWRRDHYPPPRYRRYAAEIKLETPFDTKAVSSDVQAFAKEYGVSTEAAVKVKAAFDGVKANGLESFATIGLSKKDIRTIAKRDLPASSSIKTMADKLDISEAQSRDLIKDLIAEFDAQASDVASPYWSACMGKGRWRTPENLYCTNTAWKGCSPDTGASLCY